MIVCSIAAGRREADENEASQYGYESQLDPYGRPVPAYARSDFGGGSQYSFGHQSAMPSPYFAPHSAGASAYFSAPPPELAPEMGEAIPLHQQVSNPFSSGGLPQSRSGTPFAPPSFSPPPGFLPSDEQIAADIRESASSSPCCSCCITRGLT
jgi:hypothetical protein